MERIGPYRVVRRLGGGAMGEVLEAVDDGLRRPVALKVIAPHLAGYPSFRDRFVREARALAALDSPHVVRAYAHGEHDGRLWIATQLVPDGDLGALLAAQGALPVAQAADLVAQVADGLADAHAAGLVHRDIKPTNVLVRRGDGGLTAYLGDFGIARVADDHTRTRAGGAGTPSYMAPELHTGGTAGTASDVYSLGCLLWATLTGRPPYGGVSDFEVARAHLEQPVPRLGGRGARSRALDRVLARALAKEPTARYAAAAHLARDLRAAAALDDHAAPRRRGLPAVVAAGLAVAAALGALALTSADHDDGASAPPPSAPTTAVPDRAVAVATLTEALAAQRAMTEARAACTAEQWVSGAGLGAMRDAGLFDADWRYVDRDASALTPALERAARRAAATCAPR